MARFASTNWKRPVEPTAAPCFSFGFTPEHSPPPEGPPPPPVRQVPSSASPQSPYPGGRPTIHPLLPTYDPTNSESESQLALFEGDPNDCAGIDNSFSAMSRGSRLTTARQPARARGASGASAQHRKQEQRNLHRSGTRLVALPPELIDAILSYLSAQDLALVSATCHALRKHANSDIHWQRLVQSSVPGQTIRMPGPCASFRELYATHDPLWFLPKYKIWFCDRDLMGKLIVARFDQRRGCIEAYQLLAVSTQTSFEHWTADDQVIIHGFEPQVKLHLDKPILQFRVQDKHGDGGFSTRPGANRFADEMPMRLEERMGAMFSNFMLTRSLDAEAADERLGEDYPYSNIWPPPAIPARRRLSGVRSGQGFATLSLTDRPQARSEVSDQTFRVRQWMEMAGTPALPGLIGQVSGLAGMVRVLSEPGPASSLPRGVASVHIGEELITYSTLDPALYTPTLAKPWRGIWVGDYSGHGCEFLLINQPDDPPTSDAELGLVRGERETDEDWERRRLDARVYRGRLEAVKLTGDPNVPRGEYTFVADDLGPGGLVGVASDAPFVGVRVVHSKGHVADTGFIRDKYVESQLLLISPNKLAQHWLGFGHISFFERVHVDEFIVP
ncbi:hypothetical protein RJ55_05212 [Drechmeria coniospora]|nr:hypothetical protein RJ55_05212 [Drechmeria coniospora]